MQGQNLSARYTDADYAGVIFTRGEKRVCVTVKGTRYALQTRLGDIWAGNLYASRATLEKAASIHSTELLPDIATLPEKPRDALPEFRAAMDQRLADFQATDFRRDDYSLTVGRLKRVERWCPTVEDVERFGIDPEPVESAFDFLRLIVMPSRDEIAFQISEGDVWRMAIFAENPPAMRALLNSDPLPVTVTAKKLLWRRDDIAAAFWQAVCDGTLSNVVKQLPDDLRRLDLPALPPRPATRGDGAKRHARPVARPADQKAAQSSSDQRKRTA